MRTTATCPKCSGKKIVVTDARYIERALAPSTERIPAVVYTGKGWAGGPQALGHFESWICAACGYTELYAKDLGDVDALAAAQPDDVRIVDGTIPSRGPFR